MEHLLGPLERQELLLVCHPLIGLRVRPERGVTQVEGWRSCEDVGVDDEVYVAELSAILTNRQPVIDPDDPYGGAEDGIDRYDGFGRDVWVESVAVAMGAYGAEVEVQFTLAVPDRLATEGMADHGTVRAPVDGEWRELSGFGDPRAYAPVIAQQVEFAARAMVVRHEARMRGLPPTEPASAGTHWQALLDELSSYGRVVEVAPGRVELRESSSVVVTFVVSPEQWEVVVATHVGADFELYVAELLSPGLTDGDFVVFWDGRLTWSVREALPPVRRRPSDDRLVGDGTNHPSANSGWYAYAPQQPESGPSGC